MSKYYISFGSDHLDDFYVNPLNSLVAIEANTETAAREQIMEIVGVHFCTSYPKETLPLQCFSNHIIYTIKELMLTRRT